MKYDNQVIARTGAESSRGASANKAGTIITQLKTL